MDASSFSSVIRNEINQTLCPFETHEGAATRKVKTVSEDAPPALPLQKMGHPPALQGVKDEATQAQLQSRVGPYSR